MTRHQLQSEADSVKQVVCSANTCSEATVEGLKRLLESGTIKKDVANERLTKSKAAKAPIGTTRPIAKRSKLRSVVAVVEVHEDVEQRLEVRDKIKLATEVINATLKALTDAIKAPVQPKPSKRSSLSRTPSRQSSQASIPLQVRSVNQVVGTPRSSNKTYSSGQPSSVTHDSPDPGALALAACAREALAFLRGCSVSGNGSIPLSPVQLESAMSALINKLITLGLDDLATKELRILLKRLCAGREDYPTKGTNSISKQQTLSDLLIVKEAPRDSARLDLLAASLLQVLRLISAKRRPATIEAALEHLKLSNPHSPINLVYRVASDHAPAIGEKVARQLESFTQVLQSLVLLPLNDRETVSKDPRSMLSPHIAVEYQLLVLEIRAIWWKLLGHRADTKKEINGPFLSAILNFNRRLDWSSSKKHDFCSSACIRFLNLLEGLSQSLPQVVKSSEVQSISGDVFQIIADSACDASRSSDALHYLEKCLEISKALGRSQSSICAILCQMVSVQLKHSTCSMESASPYLENLAKAIRGDLSGESAELDDLLLRTVQLQRLVLITLFGASKANNTNDTTGLLGRVERIAFDYILEFPLFLKRYLGKNPGATASIRQAARYTERKSLVAKTAIPVMESIVGLAKPTCTAEAEKWRRVDSSLSNCISFLTEFANPEDAAASQTSSRQNSQQDWRQLISGVYWCRFLGLKQQAAPPEELLKSLLTSISLLDECSPIDRLQNQLCARLDKLAGLYESTKKWTEASATYSRSLDAQVTTECISLAAASMSKKPLTSILRDEADLMNWTRTLSNFSRTINKADSKGEQSIMYDRIDLSSSLRGMILEQQLAILESNLLEGVSSQALKSALNSLANRLLEVYDADQYPIRRMRVILALLRTELISSSILTDKTRDRIFRNHSSLLPENLEEDSGLSDYACHLMASHELAFSFAREKPSVAICRTVLGAWKSVIEASRAKLKELVDNIPCWIRQLRMLAEYFGMQGLEVERAETLYICQVAQECEPGGSVDELTLCQTDLCLQLLDLGQSGEASLLLQRAMKQVNTADLKTATKFQWHLASASHLMQVGNSTECQHHLSKAESLLALNTDDGNLGNSTLTKLRQVTQKAHLSSIQAISAFSRGSIGEAIYQSRWAAKLSYRAWALLEHKANKLRSKDSQNSVGRGNLIESIAALSLADATTPVISSTKHESLNGSAFWFLVPLLVQRLLHLSWIFEHSGLVSEALYYIDQASKIADAVKASFLQSHCLAVTGIVALRRSNTSAALGLLTNSLEKATEGQTTLFHVRLHIGLHEAHALKHDWQKASSSLRDAEKAIEKVEAYTFTAKSSANNDNQTIQVENDESLVTRIETLNIASSQKGFKIKKKDVQKVSMRSKRKETIPASVSMQNCEKTEMLAILRLRGTIKRRHAFQALMQKQIKDSVAFLLEAIHFPQSQDEIAKQAIWQAQAHLLQGFAESSSNSVFCVLHESSISYPSMLQGTIQEQEEVCATSPPNKAVRATKIVSKPSTKRGTRRSTESSAVICNYFKQSFDSLKSLVLQGSIGTSSRSIHAISDRLVKSSVMLSATSCISSPRGLNPTIALYSLELGRSTTALQEFSANQAEKSIAQEKSFTRSISCADEGNFPSASDSYLDYATFQKEFVEIIPENWTVISISLSENRDELRLSKLCWRQDPFIVVIPLNRHNSRDADEEIFDFEQGKAELSGIIELANYSTHDERDFSKKGAKTEWWEARAALDARLQDLLVNIENVWLGGFRGLFRQQCRRPGLLSRFKQSFDKILDTHLPSRRRIGRVGKNSTANRVDLDPHVLELIIGLGNPNDANDLDEPLLDLLYFVIDILQFHGERNAYDEIDFDAMTVEILDALRQYHQALAQESQNEQQTHTILILDKAVHVFPWESLPCLKAQAVTRLPSLVHLRSRILDMRRQASNAGSEEPAGLRVDSHNAGYILNPSADLASTESTFLPLLTSLPSASTTSTRIIGCSPSTSDFETALTSHSLLLYFGHGSGGQYIRSRTIQKLDRCAVALLLGCSSAKLVEEGEYEPHGMVNSYLAAGAPAVVGTLWDVTDKDIDRWSLDCLERWGLFEEEKRPLQESPTKKSRGRGKEKALDVGMTLRRTKGKLKSLEEGENAEGLRGGEAKGKVSLDQAVALARDKCLMKYLNGAAPVVYGIPVYLS